jgi:catechol-2,3-dioxygenase
MTNVRGVWKEEGREQDRYIKHVTIRSMNPAALAKFYIDVFEFKEVPKALEDPNYYLTDGKVTLALTPWKIEDYHGTEHRGPGLDHLGFKVESVAGFKQDLETLTGVDPEWMSPKTPILPSEKRSGNESACELSLWPTPTLRPRGKFARRLRVTNEPELESRASEISK